MLRFIVRRLLLLVPILLGLSLLVFFWIRALPGSARPGAPRRARDADESIAQVRDQYGLDEPIYEQYWRYLQTDRLGRPRHEHRLAPADHRRRSRSVSRRRSSSRSRRCCSRSSIGIPLGFFAAKRHGGAFDHASLFVSLIGVSIPIFFLALLLKYVVRRRARLVAERRPAGRADRRRASDELLRPRRDHHAATGTRPGTRSST